jgi:hypothetical protein
LPDAAGPSIAITLVLPLTIPLLSTAMGSGGSARPSPAAGLTMVGKPAPRRFTDRNGGSGANSAEEEITGV